MAEWAGDTNVSVGGTDEKPGGCRVVTKKTVFELT